MSPRDFGSAFTRARSLRRSRTGNSFRRRTSASRRMPLAAEQLESRAMLATTATLSGDLSGFTQIPVTFLRPDGSVGFSRTAYVGQLGWSAMTGDAAAAGVPAAFKSFCIDGLQSVAPGTNSFAEVRPLAASSLLGATRSGLLADFWRQYGPADAAGFTDKTDSAAFQLAVWEIINDGLPVGTRLASDLATGQFSVAAAGRTMPAALRAAQWLAGFDTTAPGKTAVALHALQSPTRQDQVVCVPSVDLDVDSDNSGSVARSAFEDSIEDDTTRPGLIVPVGGERAQMIVDVPHGQTATLAFDAAAAAKVKVFAASGAVVLEQGRLSTSIAGGTAQTFWIEAFAPSASMADIAFTLTPTGGSPASSDTIRATAVVVDLDVDSDNVGGVQRSAAEDAIEDITDEAGRGIDATPGLYLQVQDEDSDGDGLVNWADGFNGIGDELDIDDVSAGATFAPLWFEIPELVYAPDATLEIIYSASEPSAAVMDPHYLSWDRPADGHLRIWTKDAFLPRNRASIQDGGDYVAPTSRTARSYTLAELGLQPGDNRLFLEAIRESTTTAQQEITFRLTPRFAGKPAAFTLADTVRVTTARIEVLADNRDGTPAIFDVRPDGHSDAEPKRRTLRPRARHHAGLHDQRLRSPRPADDPHHVRRRHTAAARPGRHRPLYDAPVPRRPGRRPATDCRGPAGRRAARRAAPSVGRDRPSDRRARLGHDGPDPVQRQGHPRLDQKGSSRSGTRPAERGRHGRGCRVGGFQTGQWKWQERGRR